jgi:hypothetical protein
MLVKALRPKESPEDPDPVSRMVRVLREEGFTPMTPEEESQQYGERIYRRQEKILFTEGETVFVLVDFPQFSEKVLAQAIDGVANLFKARSSKQKILSVFQSNTVYVCIVARHESAHSESLTRYVSKVGGSVVIPVVIVPEINQVVYPLVEEKKIGPVQPRLEYLQYVLGERREPVNIHKQTVRTFYISLGLVGILLLGILIGLFV